MSCETSRSSENKAVQALQNTIISHPELLRYASCGLSVNYLTEHENEFIVHHDKLIECGIMSSVQGSHVKVKLERLRLIEGEDYQLTHVGELRKQGGTSVANHYHLTPKSFKKCLMRAQRKLLFL